MDATGIEPALPHYSAVFSRLNYTPIIRLPRVPSCGGVGQEGVMNALVLRWETVQKPPQPEGQNRDATQIKPDLFSNLDRVADQHSATLADNLAEFRCDGRKADCVVGVVEIIHQVAGE